MLYLSNQVKKEVVLTLSCPGMGRAIVKIGHSNLRLGSKELTNNYLIITYKHYHCAASPPQHSGYTVHSKDVMTDIVSRSHSKSHVVSYMEDGQMIRNGNC